MQEVISLPETGSPEWHALRRTGLGGSDAAAAVGMSKWKTPRQLYLEKIGESETIENEPMRWGTILEPVVRQEYCNQTGRTVIAPGLIRHAARDCIFFNADGIADACRLYEGKTARTAEGWGEPGSDEIPQEYMLQVQHGMAVLGLEVADVAVLIGGSDFRLYTVAADEELQCLLLEQEERFWVDHVLARVPPKATTPEDVRRMWRVSSGRGITAEPQIASAVAELANVKATLKVLEEYENTLAGAIQSQMADAAELLGDDGKPLATWKNINASRRFDMAAFKAANPELHESFMVNPPPQRRFLLKVKGNPCLPQPQPVVPNLPAE